MVTRKIAIDTSITYIAISEKTKVRAIKPKTIKAGSLPSKQNKYNSENKKNP